MKEKLLWLTVVILGVALAVSHAQSAVAKQDTAGTYLLVIGPDAGTGESGPGRGVYRIDTATGKTWVLHVYTDRDVLTRVWDIIQDTREHRP
jgi:hypothetical protein